VVERGRRQLAKLINADPREIVWTSGATEADNLAIKGGVQAAAERGRHIVTSAIEHSAVLDSCEALATEGFDISYVQPDDQGIITADAVAAALREDTVLVSIMYANNELGTINDIAGIGALLNDTDILFHCDAAQAVGKVVLDVHALGIDLLAISAHKFYGPKGIGALYVRRRPQVQLVAQQHGGGHERGMRSGTLATHQIAGIGEAARIAFEGLEEEAARLSKMREQLWQALSTIPGAVLNGHPQQRLPGALNLQFEGVDGETLLLALKDLALSSGSACHSASLKPSHVLKAMGMTDTDALASIRCCLGRFTSEADLALVCDQFQQVVPRLRR